MKKLPIFLAIFVLLGALAGCKTTEANYKAAYEKAIARQNEGLTQEELSGFAREESAPKTLYHGDSIPLRARYMNTVAEDGQTTRALRYNIVVGAFAQRFNANSAVTRVREAGFSSARLLVDSDKKFFVAAATTNSLDSAVMLLRQIEQNPPIALKAPYPYILDKIGR